MSNPNPKNQFKKGNKGGGRKPMPKQILKMKTETKIDLIEIINRLSNKSTEYLKNLLFTIDKQGRKIPNEKTNVLEAIVASAFLKAISKGEPQRAEVLMQRVLGKVPDSLKLTHEKLPDVELISAEKIKNE